MKEYRDFVKNDPYCKGLLLALILLIGCEIVSGKVFAWTRPLVSLAFIILGFRILRSNKLHKSAVSEKVIWFLIIGYGLNLIYNLIQLFR